MDVKISLRKIKFRTILIIIKLNEKKDLLKKAKLRIIKKGS